MSWITLRDWGFGGLGYAGQNPGESDEDFFARMRASQVSSGQITQQQAETAARLQVVQAASGAPAAMAYTQQMRAEVYAAQEREAAAQEREAEATAAASRARRLAAAKVEVARRKATEAEAAASRAGRLAAEAEAPKPVAAAPAPGAAMPGMPAYESGRILRSISPFLRPSAPMAPLMLPSAIRMPLVRAPMASRVSPYVLGGAALLAFAGLAYWATR